MHSWIQIRLYMKYEQQDYKSQSIFSSCQIRQFDFFVPELLKFILKIPPQNEEK